MGDKPPRLRVSPPKIRTADTSIAKMPEKQADALYHDPKYLAWRKAVMQRAGYRCEGNEMAHNGPLHADHIVEIRDGGAAFDIANGQALCQSCHNKKTARMRAHRLVTDRA